MDPLSDPSVENNVLYLKKFKDCTSMFESISHLADERKLFYAKKTLIPKEEIITVLSLLEKYPATHLSVTELLNIITVNHKILNSLAVNDINIDNFREYFCELFYSWFIPSCSDTKPIIIV